MKSLLTISSTLCTFCIFTVYLSLYIIITCLPEVFGTLLPLPCHRYSYPDAIQVLVSCIQLEFARPTTSQIKEYNETFFQVLQQHENLHKTFSYSFDLCSFTLS